VETIVQKNDVEGRRKKEEGELLGDLNPFGLKLEDFNIIFSSLLPALNSKVFSITSVKNCNFNRLLA
jgi:hypothetical protein